MQCHYSNTQQLYITGCKLGVHKLLLLGQSQSTGYISVWPFSFLFVFLFSHDFFHQLIQWVFFFLFVLVIPLSIHHVFLFFFLLSVIPLSVPMSFEITISCSHFTFSFLPGIPLSLHLSFWRNIKYCSCIRRLMTEESVYIGYTQVLKAFRDFMWFDS